ncbi:sperm acrosome membrane-associated protein 6 isoform X3 [Odocoileus virginianus]|uniref:Sperm acrosome membrane-associated protein 6 isoform X3 n=1 Tax=Odocoileus virginianus TaxID=9874 RepID=A0ABM4GWN5_ODOVR
MMTARPVELRQPWGRVFITMTPSTLQGPFGLPFFMLRRKCRRLYYSLRKCRPAFLPAGPWLGETDGPRTQRSHPIGLQEVTRRFRCRGCYSKVCDLPLDCPVQDLTVTRGRQAMFSCTVNFQLPKEEITYSWKFAGGLRTQDPTYFRDIPRAQGYLARIRPVQPTHRGTFSCVITHDQRPLARLYFFLNVTGPPPRGETELQVSFREVLRWVPQEAETIEPWRPSLGELLATPGALTPGNQCLLAALVALASASVTVLAWMFFRWYCSGN